MQGTAEAVRDAVLTLGSPAVGVKVVYVGVGPVTESDVSLAAAIGGPILAFNVREPLRVSPRRRSAWASRSWSAR